MNFHKSNKSNLYWYFLVAMFFFVIGWSLNQYNLIGNANNVNEGTLGNATCVVETADEGRADLELFWTVWDELSKNYVDETSLDSKKMVYGAISGMVNALNDPYTVFMTPDETQAFNDNLEGTMEGIGAELTMKDDEIVVVTPLKESPAEKAGLLPGDIIFKVNDEFTSDMTLFEAIMKIRGKKGTKVKITIIREKVEEPIELEITRDSINFESLTMEQLKNGIAVISVNQFNDKTDSELNKAVSSLILNQPKGIIIDLRNNGGGYLNVSVDFLSYFLPNKTVAVKIRQKDMEEEVEYTSGSPKMLKVPIVVLVNNGTASAAEIVAGAVQDNKRGIVMGVQTFGKGTVQEVQGFDDSSSLRMTIAKWYTPNGRLINKEGLTPDIIVEMKDSDLEKKIDTQKEAAIKYLLELKK